MCAQHDGAAPDGYGGKEVWIAETACHHEGHRGRWWITHKLPYPNTSFLLCLIPKINTYKHLQKSTIVYESSVKGSNFFQQIIK